MTLPPILPDWMPWWAQLALLVLALLFAIALLMMPFAVFGLKGRLDLLEAQLDDIHAELRMLAMRLPDAEPARLPVDRPAAGRAPRRAMPEQDDEPEPAAGRRPVGGQERPHPLRAAGRDPRRDTRDDGGDRSEPHLRWPPAPGGR